MKSLASAGILLPQQVRRTPQTVFKTQRLNSSTVPSSMTRLVRTKNIESPIIVAANLTHAAEPSDDADTVIVFKGINVVLLNAMEADRPELKNPVEILPELLPCSMFEDHYICLSCGNSIVIVCGPS